jgi:hypothetical protein
MEEQKTEENENAVEQKDSKGTNWKKRILFWALCLSAVAVALVILAVLLIPKMDDITWTSNRMVALYVAVGVAVAGVVAWLILRKTLRTRLRMQKTIALDPDINDWLIIFDWTPKILYVPTIAAAFVAAGLMFLVQAQWWIFRSVNPEIIGGTWFAIFFVNFLVEEYNISVKVLLIVLVSLGAFFLWLHLLNWVVNFLRLFRHLALSISATGYLFVGIIGLLTIFISWLKGLFYYVTITPNYMNLQEGPTEAGEQIGREDYNSRLDTSDFLERLMGFGRIIITFKDNERQPITILVWRIQKKALLLEKVRAKFAIDHAQQAQFHAQ